MQPDERRIEIGICMQKQYLVALRALARAQGCSFSRLIETIALNYLVSPENIGLVSKYRRERQARLEELGLAVFVRACNAE